MPIPADSTPWPPPRWVDAYLTYAENEAWWTGNRSLLTSVYGGNSSTGATLLGPNREQGKTRAAILERARQFFWGAKGRTATPGAPAAIRSHLPAPANLATLSSDLQFAQPPKFILPGHDSDSKDADAVLLRNLMGSDRSLAQLGVYGETKAALGGVIAIPMWDAEVAPGEVWWESFGPDVAVPEFQSGRLAAVTLWSQVQDGRIYWRLLSHHAVENGVGYIEHALFKGTIDGLGKRVPLGDHYLGEPYVELVDENSRVLTGLNRLDAVYGINAPTIEWRKDPTLRYAGRSDFAQLHGMFDDLDRVWSSWMRDIRLGVGRTFVPSQYLTSLGRGRGAAFDEMAEYMTKLDMPGDLVDGKLPIHAQQHQIRVDEHEATLDAAYREILRKAGYSQSAWGEGSGEGGQITATEIEDRNAASERTRAKKNMHDRPVLGALARLVLEVHSAQYGGGLQELNEIPSIEFPEMIQESPKDASETVAMLNAAQSISLLMKVTRANPGWTSTQITAEVDRINAELGRAAPDPAMVDRVARELENEPTDDNDEEVPE